MPGLHVTADFGANITLTGGVSLQTQASWLEFLGQPECAIAYEGRNTAVYFEEDAFDAFLQKLDKMDLVRYVNPPLNVRGVRNASAFRIRMDTSLKWGNP